MPEYSQQALARLVQPTRVHRSLYTDPAVFEVEMELIFGRAWIYVGHESQVRNPGAGRMAVPGSQKEFGALIKAWADNGAHCPRP